MPWFTLAVLFIGFYSRVLRSNMLDAMNEDYVRTARKGISERQVRIRHVLRNSMIPIITLFGLDFGMVVGGGAILTETVYNINGVGLYLRRGDRQPRPAATDGGDDVRRVLHRPLQHGRRHPLRRPGSAHPTRRGGTGMSPILTVDDLRVSFATEDGVVQAVDGVSFELAPGEILAIVGSPAAARASPRRPSWASPGAQRHHRRIGLLPRARAQRLDDDQLRHVRGEEIAMIFQDPMCSLNPVYRVGDQITEMIQAHRDVSKKEARDRAVDLLRSVGIPNPERRVRTTPTSSPAVCASAS